MNSALAEAVVPLLPLSSVSEVEELLKRVCGDVQKGSTIIGICSEYGAEEALMEDLQRQLDTATMLQFETFKKMNSELLASATLELDSAIQASVGRISEAVDRTLSELRSHPRPAPLSLHTKTLDAIFFSEKASLEESVRSALGKRRGLDVASRIESAVAVLFELCQKLSRDVKAAHATARRSSLQDAARRCLDEISARSQSLLDSEESHLLSEAELIGQLENLVRECESGELSLLEGWGCSEEEITELFVRQVDNGLAPIRRNLLLVHGKLVNIHEKNKPKSAPPPPPPVFLAPLVSATAPPHENRPLVSTESSSLKRRRTVKLESDRSSSSPSSSPRPTPAPRFSSKKRRHEPSDHEEDDDDMVQSDNSTEAFESSVSLPPSTSSLSEQKRKAKEWSEKFNPRRASTGTSRAHSTAELKTLNEETPAPPLNPLEAAKLAAQERIKSKVQSRVSQLAHSTDNDEVRASTSSSGRRSSVGGGGKAKRKK
jgi:hypothetical protein